LTAGVDPLAHDAAPDLLDVDVRAPPFTGGAIFEEGEARHQLIPHVVARDTGATWKFMVGV